MQLARDGYVGYVNGNALSPQVVTPTHRVAVPSTFMYPEPNLKSQPAVRLTLNAQVTVTGESGAFSRLANGRFVFTAHLKPADSFESDFVAVAEMFRHVPYYWGGKSVQGLDCSGLVQLALEACGRPALRDSDMQENTLGEALMVNDLDSLQARRSRVLERPCRHHDGRRDAASCQWPSHDGGGRAAEAMRWTGSQRTTGRSPASGGS